MSIHLERQIEKLKHVVLRMGALVEEAVDQAIQAVQKRDVELADAVIKNDQAVDQMRMDVEEECLHSLALHQPVAFDLRYIVAVLKINSNLERIGDLAVNIAHQARQLSERAEVKRVPFDIAAMASQVRIMLKQSLDALVRINPELAQSVVELDQQVDEIHRAMYQNVQRAILDDPQQIEQLIKFMSICKHMERIGDHATVIAGDVLYLAKGDIFRHGRSDDAHEAAPEDT